MSVLDKIVDRFGLPRDEVAEVLAEDRTVDFSQTLPGQAADVLEVFLADMGEAREDSNGWLWYPMIRAGQHALRPGPRGEKVRKPLQIVAGKSTDPLKEIGLADLVEAFEADAVDYVTLPTSHDNKVLENTGFIRGMKIADAAVTTGPNKGKKMPTLFGGYDFTEPDVKAKVQRGTIPGRSCGILYNYLNTETGDEFPAVVEHVALTPKPWIRGMIPFGRKLSEDRAPVEFRLSDETPDEPDEIEALLAEGDATVTWTHEDSPNWLRQQVDGILRAAREEKRQTGRNRGSTSYIDDVFPYYRCNEAKSEGDGGRALVCDGYGDGSNYWVAGFTLADGQVELDDFEKWKAVKSVYVADDRDAPDPGKEPLEEPVPESKLTERDRLARAQAERKGDTWRHPTMATTTHPRGGEQHMAEENGKHQLSEEARQRVEAAEEQARKASEENQRLTEKVTRLTESTQTKDVDEFIGSLKAMGLDEQHGFTGALVELRNILLADDLEPAVVSEKFSEGGDTEVGLTLTDAFRRFFDAIEKGKDGKVALGEQLEQPGDTPAEDEPEPGKPAADAGGDEDDLSEEGAEERAKQLAADNPDLARATGITPAAKPEEKKEEVTA